MFNIPHILVTPTQQKFLNLLTKMYFKFNITYLYFAQIKSLNTASYVVRIPKSELMNLTLFIKDVHVKKINVAGYPSRNYSTSIT